MTFLWNNLLDKHSESLDLIGLETQTDGRAALQMLYTFPGLGTVRYEILSPLIAVHVNLETISRPVITEIRAKAREILAYLLDQTGIQTWGAYTHEEKHFLVFAEGLEYKKVKDIPPHGTLYIGDRGDLTW